MNFQNKIKAFLVTLLRDHKCNEVIKYFLLWSENKIDIKTRIHYCVFMVTSTVCCLNYKNAMNSDK